MIFVHTDYYRFYLFQFKINKIKSHKKVKNLMLNEIKMISKKMIFPTYNYDFGKNKIFSFHKDKSQVGSFSEYIRKKFINKRNLVPMFSSCSFFKRKSIDFSSPVDPFGKESDFDLLKKNKGKIIFFGSDFAPTYIIFIEKNIPGGVPYRFNKFFKGKIKLNSKIINCELIHYARPKKINIKYDLKKILKNLKKDSLIKVKKTKSGFNYLELDALKFYNWSKSKLSKNIYYFLTKKSKTDFLKK